MWMCKLFKINGHEKIYRNLPLSQNSINLLQSGGSWRIYLIHFLQKVWLLQFLNQTKCIKKTVVSCDVTGGITLGTKLKMPIFTFKLTYRITYKVGFWYFANLYNRNTVSNKTHQYFRDKRLVRPGSK